MSHSRILGRAILVAYLLILALGIAYSVVRFSPVPFGRVTLFMYGMLAPYQGYHETSEAFLAEGELADGTWHRIDLTSYFPVLEGERSMREHRLYDNLAGFSSHEAAHRAVAMLLRDLEAQAGRPYAHVRLTWVQWRPTPAGFWDGFDTPTQSKLLVTVP